MAQIQITCLTPVHIGSGKELMADSEFISSSERLAVIDPKKVLSIIGTENIDKWVNIINKGGGIKNYLKQRKNNFKLSDVSSREMDVYCSDLRNKHTLKEQLHDHRGFSIIPGSSLKGAIRTAVITELVNKNEAVVMDALKQFRGFRNAYDFQKLESIILNKLLVGQDRMNANKDIFRFLSVGDAYLQEETIATNVQVVNLEYEGWKIKRGTDQLTEVIDIKSTTKVKLDLNHFMMQKNIETHQISGKNTKFLYSFEDMFNIINNHTSFLLKKEIDFWKDEICSLENLNAYLENIGNLYAQTSTVGKKSAIIRLGGNSGWDSITGGWIKNNPHLLDDYTYEKLTKLLNKGRDTTVYPKTRKMDEDGLPMGFVRLDFIK